ncbi:unnamed protein product, partial [marine sediment metagenome]
GRVFSAELHLEFESIGLIQAGTIIEVELAKKYLDNRLEESVLLYIHQQSNYDNYETYSETFDLFELLQDKSILDVYGEYSFTVRLESSEANQDQLTLLEFYIETDTYIDAGPLDTHAWLTDPALNDTDADGWSDSYEIFATNTNPLNEDTDGDGAIDPKDRDPLKNIILEISPISASYRTKSNIQPPYIRSFHSPLRIKRGHINKKQIKALGITALIISSFFLGIYFYCSTFSIDLSFSVNNKKVDVNQEIVFNWNVFGSFSRGLVVFGD